MLNNLISIIIPVFNPNDIQFRESIYSLLKQDYQNYEIIVINDGTNNGFDFSSIVKLDDRIKLINLNENQGISTALNIGIDASNGDYIARMDSDDICFHNRLSHQINLMKKYDIISNNVIIIDKKNKIVGKSRALFLHNLIRRFQLYILHYNPVNHPTIFAKKKVFEEFKYNKAYDSVEDFELWLRMGFKYMIHFDKEPVIYYRESGSQYPNRELLLEKIRINDKFSYRKLLDIFK